MAFSLILKFMSQTSNLILSNGKYYRWVEASLIAAFAIIAVSSAWSWSKPFQKFSAMPTKMTSGSLDSTVEMPLFFDGSSPNAADNTHLVVLVHGWMGNSLEMKYLQQALQKEWGPQYSQYSDRNKSCRLVVYSAKCNEGRTSDGIEAGGKRLAAEINELLRRFRVQSSSQQQQARSSVSSSPSLLLSLVGNSLGGLYARHAISQVDWNLVDEPVAFVTTATPHLGVSYPHTYLPLHRTLEWAVANILQQTGRDLFMQSQVLEQLASEEKYLTPLQRFQRRIAYANSFGTDFQVPTATAGFLSSTSTSPHTIIQPQQQQQQQSADESFIVAIAETRSTDRKNGFSSRQGRYESMAENLDALGWTKVFCDVREALPSITLPFSRGQRQFRLSSSDISSTTATPRTMERTTTSKELYQRLTSPSSDQWHFPAGHTMLVANSKDEVYANLNKWGRPIMDRLAREILQESMMVINQQ